MAVKIQIKRGSKAGLPTLAPGEYGLATDTGELFVGGEDGNIQVATLTSSGFIPVAQIPGLSASKITSGTLPITRGGTGATTAAAARTALGAAAASHTHEAAAVGAVSAGDEKNITIQGGGVMPVYPSIEHHARTVTPTTLDDLAWEGLSYRDIFQAANAVYEDYDKSTASWMGHSDDRPNLKFWVYGSAGGTSMSDTSASGKRSLRITNTNISLSTSYQLQSMRKYTYNQGDSVYLASMLNVTVITLGSQTSRAYHGCGLNVRHTDNFDESIPAVQKVKTDGFVLTSALGEIPTTGEYSLYIGCLGGYINAACYVDCPAIINLSNLFDVPPDKSTMDLLYSNYIALLNGSNPQQVNVPAWTSDPPMEFSDQDCVNAFMAEVNRKAAEIGMDKSYFLTPSGVALDAAVSVKLPYKRTDSDVVGETETMMSTNESTAGNMARMVAAAMGYPEIGRIWRKKTLTIELGGCEKRALELSHTVKFDDLEGTTYSNESHPYLGAKGGAWGDNLSLTAITLSSNGTLLAHAVTTTQGETYPAIGKLADLAERALAGEDVSQETVPDVTGAVTLQIPSGATWLFDSYAYKTLYQTGADEFFNPASTSKLMTAMVALDWCPNARTQMVKLEPIDNVGFSGNRFLMGQTMSLESALQAMLIISSNSMAHAIARTVGRMILQTRHDLDAD